MPSAAPADVIAAATLLASAEATPAWVDWGRVRRGQLFFERNSLPLLVGLLNLSLTGGFGAPKINAVLERTGYLTRGNRVMRRLSETLQMVLDCLPLHALRPGVGSGWRSVLNVRLLHAGVRTWLVGPPSHAPAYDVAALGTPINQEDALVTQLAFSLVPLMGLERVGLLCGESVEALEDYLHLWRLLGHLLGLHPALNSADAATLPGAQATLESVASHVVYPDPSAARISAHVIEQAVGPPLRRSPAVHVLLTRALAGDSYADALGIPRLGSPALVAMARRQRAAAEGEVARRWAGGGGGAVTVALWRSGGWLWAAACAVASLLMRCARAAVAAATWGLAGGASSRGCPSEEQAQADRMIEEEAAAAADGARLLAWLRLWAWATHLPVVGAPLARATTAAVAAGVRVQLGGRRTSFPVRQRYVRTADERIEPEAAQPG